jgi:sugar/nucleoside kinase (ribokinase family)
VVLDDPAVHVTGVAANIGLTLAALGVGVAVASAVGRDALGDLVLAELQRGGVEVGLVHRSEAPTATFVFMIDRAGERTMVGTRGASERFDLDPSVLDDVRPAWVHVSGYTLLDPAMASRCEGLVDEAARRSTGCSVDLEGIAGSGRTTALDRCTVFCNRTDHRAYFGRDEVRPTGRPAPLVIKAGEAGCVLAGRSSVEVVPTRPATAVDSTGAGDAFDAAFVAATLHGLSPTDACRWGNAAARMKVQSPGPRVELSAEAIQGQLGDDALRSGPSAPSTRG